MNRLNWTAPERELTTSDAPERARSEALRRLWNGGYLALRDVECDVRGATAWLRGALPSYYLIQVACEIVSQVPGVRRVVSDLEVLAPPGFQGRGDPRASRSRETRQTESRSEVFRGGTAPFAPERSLAPCWS
jgi:hypothetical protein